MIIVVKLMELTLKGFKLTVTRVMYKSLKTVIELTASLLCDRREGLGIQEMMDWCPMCVVEREHLSCFMPQKQEISCLAITSA